MTKNARREDASPPQPVAADAARATAAIRPSARVCLTGSELTRGETRDINGSFLGTRLTSLGLRVDAMLLVPDDPALLAEALSESMQRADVVVASGGLGPTADDHTVRVLARVLGQQVVQDPEAREIMRRRVLDRVGTEDRIPSNYFKQAEVVEGSTVLLNPVGLAPGSLVDTPRGFVVTLPGVPRELREMFDQCVVPRIRERFELASPRISRAKILGVGESWAESRIQALGIDFERLEYGISARPGELLIKLIAHELEHHTLIDDAMTRLGAEFGEAFLPMLEGLVDSTGDALDTGHSRLVHEALLSSGKTLATAESCTGGLVAKLLTDHAGSSTYFLGSVVAYHNDIKASALGLDPALIDAHGAVSDAVCRAMAFAARRVFRSGYGIGITGVAGPGGGSKTKPVGTVFVGLARPDDASVEDVLVTANRFYGDRPMVRQQAAIRALELVRREVASG